MFSDIMLNKNCTQRKTKTKNQLLSSFHLRNVFASSIGHQILLLHIVDHSKARFENGMQTKSCYRAVARFQNTTRQVSSAEGASR